MTLLSLCLLLLLDDPALVFPLPMPAVTPQPQDVAPGPIRIRPDEWLLVSGKRQCLLIAIPEGVISISEQQLQAGLQQDQSLMRVCVTCRTD